MSALLDALDQNSRLREMLGWTEDGKYLGEQIKDYRELRAEVHALRQQLAASVEKSERLNSERAEEWHRANCEEETAAQLKAQLAASEQARAEAVEAVDKLATALNYCVTSGPLNSGLKDENTLNHARKTLEELGYQIT